MPSVAKTSQPYVRSQGVGSELRAIAASLVFFLKVFPMLPSKPVDWATAPPVIQKLSYQTRAGLVEGELYRPASGGPHPGAVISFGVVPLGVEHPQVARFGTAMARAGFAVLLYWSPAMRDLRLDPADGADLASAYQTLIEQPFIDPTRSGFIGMCVGGACALMAAASPHICSSVTFVSAYAPYYSMRTLVRDIASATRTLGATSEPWQVDPLTWRTYVRTLTDSLQPHEMQAIRSVYEDRSNQQGTTPQAQIDSNTLSDDGRAVLRLLRATERDSAEAALRLLPTHIQERFTALSPEGCIHQIEAPLILLLHDRYDPVIPVGETRRLWAALAGRAGVSYTEMGFRHLDPTKLSPLRLTREIPRLYGAMYPLFRHAMG